MARSSPDHLRLVEALEDKLGIRLPDRYRQDLLKYNVSTPDPNSFKLPNTDKRLQVFSFLGITEVVNDSIWDTYQMLRTFLPDNLIPIASLTNGGFICIGIRGNEKGKIFYIGDRKDTQVYSSSNNENITQIAENYEEFIALFDEEGEIDRKDEKGWSLLHKAAGKGIVEEIYELLGYGADIDLLTNNGYTPLFIATSEGKVEAVKILLEAGADISITSETSQGSPFHVACAQGYEEIVDTFLRYDKSLANVVLDDVTPLYIAADLGHTEVVNVLLKYGADVNLRPNKKSATPLYMATYNGHRDIVEILLKHKADAEAGYDRATPLHAAALQGHVEIAKLLLQYGAEPNKKDREGKTPLDIAKVKGNETMVKLFNLRQ